MSGFFWESTAAEVLSVIARMAVGATLLVAGGAKLIHPDFFARSLRQLLPARVFGHLARRGRSLGVALGIIEVVAGAAFALGVGLVLAGVLIVGLLAVFSITLSVALIQGRRASCGCFGRKRVRQIQWLDLGRNALLAALATAGCQSAGASLDQAAPPSGFFVLLLTIGASFLYVWHARQRLRPALASSVTIAPSVLFAVPTEGGGGGHRERKPRPERKELSRRYAVVAEHERRAAEATVDLDQHKLMALGPQAEFRLERRHRRTAEARRDDWRSQERELLVLDGELNKELRALYTAAVEETQSSSDGVSTLVRTALLHWTILLRRRAMENFHTRVTGLDQDEDCAGDLIGDGLLQRYFDALFRERADLQTEFDRGRFTTNVGAMRALTELARQSACLGQQQSAMLASHLYWSFVELSGYLRLNGLATVVPYVAHAASAPMLLFYDVEKYRGLDSPLARWFSQHYGMLAEGVATRRLPSCWHGLWLYDWRSGHLVGYRMTSAQRDENDVDGVAFLRSITQRENLGNYDCSFSEMIERSPGQNGYVCAGSTCSDRPPRTIFSAETVGKLFTTLGSGLVKGFGVQTGGRGRQSHQVASSTVCAEGTDGKTRGDAPSGCDGGLDAAGRTRESSAVRCLSEQVVSPTERLLSCYGEQTGRCADPLGSLVKDLQQTAYIGVKLGDGCSLKEEAGDDAGTDDGAGGDAGAGDAGEAADDAEQAQKELDEAIEELEKKDEEWQEKKEEFIEAEAAQDEADKKLDEQAPNTPEQEEAFKDWEEAVDAKVQAERDAAAAGRARDAAYDKAVAAWEKKNRLQNGRCPADTPNCGGNGCSAMSEAARQTMECFQRAVEPGASEFQRPWGPNADPVVDPSPDAPVQIDMPCFEALFEPDAAPAGRVAQACWALDCGPGYETVGDPVTGCRCLPRDGDLDAGGLRGNCADVYCSEGQAVFRNGHCECGQATAGPGGPGGGPTPTLGPFTVGSTPSFSQTQEQLFGPDWPRV